MHVLPLFPPVQFSSVSQSCPILFDPMNCSTPGFPVHHQLLEFTRLTSIESVMPSSHLILCHPLLLLPPIPPSIRVFSNESTLRMRSFPQEPCKWAPGSHFAWEAEVGGAVATPRGTLGRRQN